MDPYDNDEYSWFETLVIFTICCLFCFVIWHANEKGKSNRPREMRVILNIISSENPVLTITEYEKLSEIEKTVFFSNKGTIK